MFDNIDFDKAPLNPPSCMECGAKTRLADASTCYPDEPHLHDRPMWICECGAFAGCQPGTLMPKVRPAGAEVRAARHLIWEARSKFWERVAADCASKTQARKKYWREAMRLGFGIDLSWASKKAILRVAAICQSEMSEAA